MNDQDTRADQDGELNWETVRSVGTEEEATIIVGYLRAQGIPAQMESVRFNQEPVNFGDMADVRVRVPDEYRAQALELLSDRETDDLAAEAAEAQRASEGTAEDVTSE